MGGGAQSHPAFQIKDGFHQFSQFSDWPFEMFHTPAV
jgi:hypothetical protein